MNKEQNMKSSQKLPLFNISKYYKNEIQISNTIFNLNFSKNTSLKSCDQLNAREELLNLLEGDNISYGKFTFSNKTTKYSDDGKMEAFKEEDKDSESNDLNKKYQNDCESSDISD